MKARFLTLGIVVAALALVPMVGNANLAPKGRQLHGWGWATINDPATDEALVGILICKVIPGELNPIMPKPNSDGDPTTGDEDFGGICDLDCTNTVNTPASCAIAVNHKIDKTLGVEYNVCFDADKDGFYLCPFPKVKKFFVYAKTPANDVPSLFVSWNPAGGNLPPIKYQAVATDP